MTWTPERENKLRELWKKGHTASQIAALIGNTTRNAVIGKVHRLNLEARIVSKKILLPLKRRRKVAMLKSGAENLVEKPDLNLCY